MLPQRGIPQRPMPGAFPRPSVISPGASSRKPSQSLLSPKGVLSSPLTRPGMPSRTSPWSSRPLSRSPLRPSVLGTRKPALAPKVPGSIFEIDGKKQIFTETQMRERIRKVSPFLLKGKTFTKLQRERMIKQWFPWQKAQGFINERKTTQVLKELRHKEFLARNYKEKKSLKISRKLLEAFTRVKKY